MTPHNVVSGNRKSGNYSHEEIQRSQHYIMAFKEIQIRR